MSRRRFCRMVGVAAAATASSVWLLVKKTVPPRIVVALRTKTYPGEVRPIDETEIAKPGKWAG